MSRNDDNLSGQPEVVRICGEDWELETALLLELSRKFPNLKIFVCHEKSNVLRKISSDLLRNKVQHVAVLHGTLNTVREACFHSGMEAQGDDAIYVTDEVGVKSVSMVNYGSRSFSLS